MTKIISSVTQKGGNGKTTLSLNLAYELGLGGSEVLLLDEDPQASLGKNIIGEDELPLYPGIEDLYLNPDLEYEDYIVKTGMQNVSILPCHSSLAGIPSKLIYEGDGFFTLKKIINNIEGFDYIIIDTPGNLEFLTLSALIASHYLIVPVYPAYYSMLAVNDLMNAIEKMRSNFNAGVEILGVVLTMMDRRANLYKDFEDDVREVFKDKVFRTTTSRTVKSEEATVESIGVSGMFPNCTLSKEYQALTQEILDRLNS